MLRPRKLKPGDKIRFVSPASTPDREQVLRRAAILERWGFSVDFGPHAFSQRGFLAGTDEERLADLNAALRDPAVRAVFTTRGGRGSYRIADGMDFAAITADPKPLVGFSDITILQLMLWKQCRLAGIHGTVLEESGEAWQNNEALQMALSQSGWLEIEARPTESTAMLSTSGRASGPLIGGNLDMIATAAGWALPNLYSAILLLEGVDMRLGQVDRQLTMLQKAGHLEGIAGIAIGQFTKCREGVLELLHHHLCNLDVPVLGGLPLGHGSRPTIAPVGMEAQLDVELGRLSVAF